MFHFLETVVGPLISATKPTTIVEIGALRGDNTKRVLDLMSPESILHVVDPAPAFDVAAYEARFGERYRFHRALSVDVLPELPPADLALIDGDHNWYTVHSECNLLADAAAAAGRPLPVMVFHDTGWPYARRDMYYDPANVPAEHRHPHAKQGMSRGKSALVEGGLNRSVHNAMHEGGPRNGVATGIDDFVASRGAGMRRVEIPVYFGLTILVDEDRSRTSPEITEVLDGLESAAGRLAQAELGERIRVDGATFRENILAHSGQQHRSLIGRYLALVRKMIAAENPDVRAASSFALDALQSRLDDLRRQSTKGDLVDCGGGAGGVLMRAYLEAHGTNAPQVWLADRFRSGRGVDLNRLREMFDDLGLLDERVHFLQGEIPEVLVDAPLSKIALLRIGPAEADRVDQILEVLYPKLAPDGIVLVESGVAAARDFCESVDPDAELVPISGAGVWWRKRAERRLPHDARRSPVAVAVALRDPLPRVPVMGLPTETGIDLSVVVVFWNMAREATRTLHSLSRAYQEGLDDITTEIIAIDNGSEPGQRLDEATVEAFGPEFRLITMDDTARPSPTGALNAGGLAANGRYVAFMVDGAHVLTPGVFQETVRALDFHTPAVVAVQPWFVGPGLQPRMVAQGYDGAAEDKLFESIDWPADGHRLFEIGHFVGTRDWFDFMTESGFLAAPRSLFSQVGMFDDSFDEPGGGYASLDLFERLGSSPGHQLVSLLGEATFHQTHGGTTTRPPTLERDASISGFASHYEILRGKPFTAPTKEIRYVGSLPPAARRTRARRLISTAHAASAPVDDHGMPSGVHPIQAELSEAFVEAVWHSGRWTQTSWLGRQVDATPDDLFFIHELVVEDRPEVIVDIGGGVGHALFLASLCDLVDGGEVIWVTTDPAEPVPQHPRLTQIRSDDPAGARTVETVFGAAAGRTGLLILAGRATRADTLAQFSAYRPLVSRGGHVVVEYTIVNGNPVWDRHGPGPGEAARSIVTDNPDFEVDPRAAGLPVSFHRGGFLRRSTGEGPRR